MSLSLAKAWVDAKISPPQARADASRLLDEAAAQDLEATLIVGTELSRDGKCYLGRWDGRELVVRELTQQTQREWQIPPKLMFQQLEPVGFPQASFPSAPLVSLSLIEVESPESYNGWQPLRGTCTADIAPFYPLALHNCALRAEYFRPDLPRQATALWYVDIPLQTTLNILHFQFPPLFSLQMPATLRGGLAVFLQLFTAGDWATQSQCMRISNVENVMLTLR